MLHFPMFNLRHKILKVSPLHNNIITCPFICLSKKKKKKNLLSFFSLLLQLFITLFSSSQFALSSFSFLQFTSLCNSTFRE